MTTPHIQSSIFNWTYLRCYWRYLDNSMSVILQPWCQIQPTSSNLCYVNCGPGHIQSTYSSAYLGFNIQLKVAPLLFEVSRRFNERNTAKLVTTIAQILQLSLCDQWSRTYTMYLQLRIFRPEYSTERICAAIGDNRTYRCALHCKFGVKYSPYRPVYAVWSVVPYVYNAFTAPHIQTTMFIWTYLSCYWRYLDNSIVVIMQTWCQIKRTSSRLRYVNCGPGRIQYIYSSAHSDFNIHLNVSALLLEISRQSNARFTANLVPNTAHILRFTLCELWSRTYTMHLQLHLFRLQYSFERICSAIVHITTIQCVLYCKLVAKYSARPPVYAMWPVVPDIYNTFTAPHIQTSIFIWTYLRCYWKYLDNSMLVILQTWFQIQRISSRLRYVNCGPDYIQSTFSSTYLNFNIQL
jgi:hypothetical protein